MERDTKAPERHQPHEKNTELQELRVEQLRRHESAHEQSPESNIDRAEQARESLKRLEPNQDVAEQEVAPSTPAISGLTRHLNYRQTVASMQQRLSPASRQFSRIIHNPAVDKVSEVAGKTIFRPSVSLGATISALIFGTFIYLTARHYGFALRGPELPLALLVGGIVGLLVEFLYRGMRKLSRQ